MHKLNVGKRGDTSYNPYDHGRNAWWAITQESLNQLYITLKESGAYAPDGDEIG